MRPPLCAPAAPTALLASLKGMSVTMSVRLLALV
jgi:hypothetical protein